MKATSAGAEARRDAFTARLDVARTELAEPASRCRHARR
jgi:hypothetical protein